MTDRPTAQQVTFDHPTTDDAEPYAKAVERMADAIHECCRVEWQAKAVVIPGWQGTQHGPDAHYGLAHSLVRRYGIVTEPQP